MAIWYHDIIIGEDGEKKSAFIAFADAFATTTSHNVNVAEIIFYLIKATDHSVPISKVGEMIIKNREMFLHNGDTICDDIKIIRDIDLQILSSSKEEYYNYSVKARAENYAIDPRLYNDLRIVFMEKFLARDRIYETSYFDEKKARKNIEREIKILKKG